MATFYQCRRCKAYRVEHEDRRYCQRCRQVLAGDTATSSAGLALCYYWIQVA